MIEAALPDPSQPSFVLLAAALGAFIGATISRVRRVEREDLRANVENWAYALTVAGFVVYVVILAIQST
jgi:hypothetical protein